ncbi:MAG: hypothetical protein V7765_21750 [Oleispira sp.]|jgi:hypothetical protein
MFNKLLSKILKSKNAEYHPAVNVCADEMSKGLYPIKAVYLIKQPNNDNDLAFRVDYDLPSYCVSHSAYLSLILNGQVLSSIWLEVDKIARGKKRFLMNSISRSVVSESKLVLHFSDEKYPVSNIYTYEIATKDFNVT